MHLSSISIRGYRCFGTEFEAKLNSGLTVIVGENGSGKTSIIDSIRLLFSDEDTSRFRIDSADFHRPINLPASSKGAKEVYICCKFNGLGPAEQVAYLPWLAPTDPTKATLTLQIENKEDVKGFFKRNIWGGESSAGIFEGELLSAISCIYLPPLRDAEDRLRAFRGSRLARLLKNLRTDSDGLNEHPLETKFNAFNKELLNDETIKLANRSIRQNLVDSVGQIFGQDAMIQFSEVNFDRIVERLRLLFYPILPETGKPNELDLFRELGENSLGYNNILYLATVLAELEGLTRSQIMHRILLIEEPEAHLHPQLQRRLLRYLENKSFEHGIQVVLTTHSPTIAASAPIDTIKVFTIGPMREPSVTDISQCGLSEDNKYFLQRWLDITKSTLLFAKGVLLVEGIAEALVVPELAKMVILDAIPSAQNADGPRTLEDFGVSIINMGGRYLNHFLQLFKGYSIASDKNLSKHDKIPILCSGITDCDPEKDQKPTPSSRRECLNTQAMTIDELKENSANCRVFSNLKTFEYDLAIQGNNLSVMSRLYASQFQRQVDNKTTADAYAKTNWNNKSEPEKADAAFWLLSQVESSKGEYAQSLAKELGSNPKGFTIPDYIREAVLWVIGKGKFDAVEKEEAKATL